MQIDLKIKPKNPIVIEGFPGFGLVGTIATEFLLEHLQTEHIGHIFFEEMPATIAIHKNKVIDPISVNYSKKYNLVIIHAITSPTGIEWKMADTVLSICKQLGRCSTPPARHTHQRCAWSRKNSGFSVATRMLGPAWRFSS